MVLHRHEVPVCVGGEAKRVNSNGTYLLRQAKLGEGGSHVDG
jgi:hypothetical protein